MIIAQSCIWYILLSEFDVPWVKLSNNGRWKASPRLSRFLKDHEFLDYASRHWRTHFKAASPSAHDSLTNSARDLCCTESPRFRTWYKVYWSSFSRPKTYSDLGEAAAFKLGLGINAVDGDGDTPLHTACMHGRYDTAKYLIEHGTASGIGVHNGNVALSKAAALGLTRIVELLLREGVDINPHNKQGKTPLDRAHEFGHTDCVEKLLEYGA